MKNIKTLITISSILLLSACGGGSSVEFDEPTITSQGFTATIAPTSQYILQTKVIDGYISGANVYIDFNWNLVQDEGEPSATEDLANEEYYFVESQFILVDDYDLACANLRPRVAEVPVGATDSVRGTVENAYTMMYFPYDNASERANITPFTTLFTQYIVDSLTNDIPIEDGCQSGADNIGSQVSSRISDVLFDLHQQYYINPIDFYDDFIASEDTEKQEIGEKIVDFLTTSSKIEDIVGDHYNLNMISTVSDNLVETILANTPFETITFDIYNESEGTSVGDTFFFKREHSLRELVANQTGQILDSDGNPIEITLENIQANAEVMVSESYISYELLANNTIRIGVDTINGVVEGLVHFYPSQGGGCRHGYIIRGDSRFVEDLCLTSNQKFEFRIHNTDNTAFSFTDVMNSRDTYQLIDMHTSLVDLNTTVADRDNFVNSYHTHHDVVQYTLDNWVYTYNGQTEICQNMSTNEQESGYSAYLLCLNNM
jgi:hypothetical protein